ncbi:hypothetical protein V8E36_009869 [Tilletia maclaganii]
MPSALLPARDVRLPPPQAAPAPGHHHHHHHGGGGGEDGDDDSHDSHSHSGESHSSYQRRHAPPDAPPPPTSLTSPTLAALSILLLLLLLHLLGLGLFTRGFLLTRRQLDGVRAPGCSGGRTNGAESYIPPAPLATFAAAAGEQQLDAAWTALTEEECALPAQVTYDRAVVLIVDALRYDFLAPLPNASASAPHWAPHPHQHGHLRTPAELIARHPSHGFLAHFYADPPTTTLQRIKGLTTGTLPTFVDASANFGGGQRIEEDNWIAQLRARAGEKGGKVIFAGDDTWMGLFTNTFDSATPFDSFNVHDLDTVDEGVRRVLVPYLAGAESEPWSLLLLHNLGLDHAGHRFSSTHPSIKRKLQETDTLVRDIVEKLAPEPGTKSNAPRTLFVLLGDHGMDPQGDHGGDAELEVGAGLFVWGSGRTGGFSGSERVGASETHIDVSDLLNHNWNVSEGVVPPSRIPFSPLGPASSSTHRTVAQIDLVPSLSLLLGQPIPFNSLGTVIPELFAQAEFDSPNVKADPGRDILLRALRLNAHQIRRYLRAYSSGSGADATKDESELAAGKPSSKGGALGAKLEAELEQLWQATRRADAHFASSLAHDRTSTPESITQARRAASRAYFLYTRAALTRAREVWATFEMRSIYLGLGLLGAACAAVVGVYLEAGREVAAGKQGDEKGWIAEVEGEQPGTARVARRCWGRAGRGAVGVGMPSAAVWVALELKDGFAAGSILRVVEATVWSGALGAALALAALPARGLDFRWIALVAPAACHAALFASNSTILREDYIVLLGLFAILALIYGSLARSLSRPVNGSSGMKDAPSSTASGSLRFSRRSFVLVKAGMLCIGIVLCARVGRYGSLCREEHGPTCVSNFYATPRRTQPVAGGSEFGDTGGSAGHTLAPHMSVSGGLAAVAEGGATNSIPAIVLAYVCAYALPGVLQLLLTYARFGGSSGTGVNRASHGSSNVGIAPRFLGWIVRPALLAAVGHWAADRLSGDAGSTAAAPGAGVAAAGGQATAEWAASVAVFVGRASVVFLGVASLFWLLAPMCIEFRQVDVAPAPAQPSAAGQQKPQPTRKQVQLLGFGNAFGSTYLLLVTIVFGLLFVSAQPSGQVTLSFSLLALVLLAELGAEIRAASRSEADVGELWTSAVALLAHNAFFSTGHQATLSAIQWRTAFVLTRTVVYPWSPILVILNALGPLAILPAAGVGLGVLWGLIGRAAVLPPNSAAPNDEGVGEASSAADLAAAKEEHDRKRRITAAHMYTILHLLRVQLGLALYFGTLTLGSAVWSTVMRRHLMLYKVWTPRFMLAAMAGVGVQVVGAVVGVGVVGAVVLAKGATMFGSRFR